MGLFDGTDLFEGTGGGAGIGASLFSGDLPDLGGIDPSIFAGLDDETKKALLEALQQKTGAIPGQPLEAPLPQLASLKPTTATDIAPPILPTGIGNLSKLPDSAVNTDQTLKPNPTITPPLPSSPPRSEIAPPAPDLTGQAPDNQLVFSGRNVNDIASYIYQKAPQYGVNPNTALGIARFEGLNPNTINHPTFGNRDAKGYSFGPYQLYSGSPDPNNIAPGGMASEFSQKFGARPSADNVQQQVDFALERMGKGGYGNWYAVRDQGGLGAITEKGQKFAASIGLQPGDGASLPDGALSSTQSMTTPGIVQNKPASSPAPRTQLAMAYQDPETAQGTMSDAPSLLSSLFSGGAAPAVAGGGGDTAGGLFGGRTDIRDFIGNLGAALLAAKDRRRPFEALPEIEKAQQQQALQKLLMAQNLTKDQRDFQFRTQESQRAQQNADRSSNQAQQFHQDTLTQQQKMLDKELDTVTPVQIPDPETGEVKTVYTTKRQLQDWASKGAQGTPPSAASAASAAPAAGQMGPPMPPAAPAASGTSLPPGMVVPSAKEIPNTGKEYMFDMADRKKRGEPTISVSQWNKERDEGKRSQTNTTINNAVNPILKGLGDQFTTSAEEARAAADSLRSINAAREQLDGDGGVVTGALANDRLALQKLGTLIGITDPKAVENTETFRAAVKPIILSSVKALGTNPSNTDREFVEQASGGSIKLDEGTIRRVMDLQDRAARAKIERHNSLSDKMLETQPGLKEMAPMMKIDMPESYQKKSAGDGASKVVPTLDAVPEGARFRAPDGKVYRKRNGQAVPE